MVAVAPAVSAVDITCPADQLSPASAAPQDVKPPGVVVTGQVVEMLLDERKMVVHDA